MITQRQPRSIAMFWLVGVAGSTIAALAFTAQDAKPAQMVVGIAVPTGHPSPPVHVKGSMQRRLSQPEPNIVPESRANPAAIPDKYHARFESAQTRARLRAFEGAPPVIPHTTDGLTVQACRECHGQGLRAGDKVARMVSHTYLASCTQCHVEEHGQAQLGAGDIKVQNLFEGLRPSGYGSTRAWVGAPPVMPHTTFMRTNCISCHGEYGYDGWRPDHLSRTNCIQCHAPGAEFDQQSPLFGKASSETP